MTITEIRVSIEPHHNRVLAYFRLTLDNCLIITNVRLISGDRKKYVAMPSRKSKKGCKSCGSRISMDATYCSVCGNKFPATDMPPVIKSNDFRRDIYHDVVHPIDPALRSEFEQRILRAYIMCITARLEDAIVRFHDNDEIEVTPFCHIKEVLHESNF